MKSDTQSKDTISIGEQVVSSTLWMGSWRWSARLIGFGTTIILARQLVPEDFGILATGSIIMGFFAIMTGLGTDSYLIRLENPDRDDYDTAWTLRFIVISIASIAIFFAAQPGADYFEDQRIVAVLQVLAVVGWLDALTNIGLVMYRRDLQFRKIALIGISQRITASTITIALAFLLKNYWAMVVGEMAFMLVGLVLSYTQHSYRPKFKLINIRKQWDFCKWIVVQNIATFISSQGGSFVIVKYFGIELMGVFAMAGRVAALPTKQLIAPVLPPVYSGLAKKQHDPEEFIASVLKVIGATAVLVVPGATLVACLSEEIVITVLGARWEMAIPLVAPLTLSVLLGVLAGPAGLVLTIKGRVKLLAGWNWFSAVAGLVVLLFAVQWFDIVELVWMQVGVALLFLMVYYGFMLATVRIPVLTLLGSFYRPLLASLAMALVIYLVSSMIGSAWLVILAAVVFGGASYLLVATLLWWLAGSPDSGEAMLVRKLLNIIARKLNK